MGIFEQKVLQRLLDESHQYANQKSRRVWASKLNSSSSPDYVATEWELALLGTMSGLGQLSHEPELGGRSRVDAVLVTPLLTLCAEITAISDRFFFESNPLRQLEVALDRILESEGLREGGITFDVIGLGGFPIKGKKQPELLPPFSEFEDKIFTSAFTDFMGEIKREPAERKSLSVALREYSSLIRIFYVSRGDGVSCASFNRPQTTELEVNPLFKALKRKASQLKKCGFQGVKGVVVCDAGAEILRPRLCGETYSARDVVHHFFVKHTSVDFVVLLTLRNAGDHTIRQRVEYQILAAESQGWHEELLAIIAKLVKQLPEVIQTPENAMSELKYWEGKRKRKTHLGAGMTITYGSASAKEVRMSATALVELLAGRMHQRDFLQRFKGSNGRNVFEQQLKVGCRLEAASVIKDEKADNDEIVLRFGEPDPAAFKFIVR